MGNTLEYYRHPDVTPYDHSPLEFDPHFGFPEGARKKKGKLSLRSLGDESM